VLPDCAIAISAVEAAVDVAADGGAELLTGIALASIFQNSPGQIAIDPRTAALIGDDFIVETGPQPVLRGERVRQP
jgi:hypothetical protein